VDQPIYDKDVSEYNDFEYKRLEFCCNLKNDSFCFSSFITALPVVDGFDQLLLSFLHSPNPGRLGVERERYLCTMPNPPSQILIFLFLHLDVTTSIWTCSPRSEGRMWRHSLRLRSEEDIVERFRLGNLPNQSCRSKRLLTPFILWLDTSLTALLFS